MAASVASNSSRRVAYLSMDPVTLASYGEHHELLTLPYMKDLGWDVDVNVNWHDAHVIDWSVYRAVVIRTPWDYQKYPVAFLAALEHIHTSFPSVSLLNGVEIARWNIDKHYLADLEKTHNVPTVPTVWSSLPPPPPPSVETASSHRRKPIRAALAEAFVRFPQCQRFVIKPCISAGSDFTFRCAKSGIDTVQLCSFAHGGSSGRCAEGEPEESSSWLSTEDSMAELESVFDGSTATSCICHFMIQPFLPAILAEGEFSVFLLRGEVSHVTQKVPVRGDFRVQEQFGGAQLLKDFHSADDCPVGLRQAVQTLLASFPPLASLLYARVDLVRDADRISSSWSRTSDCPQQSADVYLVAELELIEPSMYFAYAPGSAEKFALAFHKMMEVAAKDDASMAH